MWASWTNRHYLPSKLQDKALGDDFYFSPLKNGPSRYCAADFPPKQWKCSQTFLVQVKPLVGLIGQPRFCHCAWLCPTCRRRYWVAQVTLASHLHVFWALNCQTYHSFWGCVYTRIRWKWIIHWWMEAWVCTDVVLLELWKWKRKSNLKKIIIGRSYWNIHIVCLVWN